MKKLVFILFLLFSFASYGQFGGSTKHKPVKKMTKMQVRNAQRGKTFYVHHKGKVKKNKSYWR